MPRSVILIAFLFASQVLASEPPDRSGSLLVQVFSDDRVPLAKASLEALVPDAWRRSPRLEPLPLLGKATTDEKGWATLSKLPAGPVVLQVLPSGRTQPYITEPIEIREAERLVVDDLIVPSPSELVIHLDSSDSVREHLSAGRIDEIRVAVSSPRAKALVVNTKGDTAVFEEVLPGKWTVRPLMIIGGTTYVLDPSKGIEVDVHPGTRIDATFRIPALVLAGRATLRGEPFHGQMHLMPAEPKPGNWGFAVPFDEEGRFAFPLPRAGAWDVSFITRDRKMTSTVPAYVFHESDARGEIELELPEGAIAGKVVDARGNRVAGARVMASREREGKARQIVAGVTSEDDGAFVLDGLVEGTWTLTASNDRAASEPLQISLMSESRSDGIVVRLTRQKRQIRIITAAGEPLPRATVTASALSPERRITRSRFVDTDAEGRAGIDVDAADGTPLAIIVERGPWILTFLRPAADEMTLTAARPDATIRFAAIEPQDRRVLVREDGSFFALADWRGRLRHLRTKEPVQVRVLSGVWHIVVADTPRKREQLYLGLGFGLPAERQFHVAPGATMVID